MMMKKRMNRPGRFLAALGLIGMAAAAGLHVELRIDEAA